MKDREFVLRSDRLGIEYIGDLDQDLVEEHYLEPLEIPSEHIESLQYGYDYVSIKLSKKRDYFNEDWYVNLRRIA